MFKEGEFERRLFAVDWSAYERVGFGSIPKAILGVLRAKAPIGNNVVMNAR